MAVPAHDERDFEFAKKYNSRHNESSKQSESFHDVEIIPRDEIPIKQSIMFVDKRPNAEAERRRTISAIIQRKSDNKFLFLKWKKF